MPWAWGISTGDFWESGALQMTFVDSASQRNDSRHFGKCVSASQMSTSQLATNVLNFAKDKPEYHTGSVQAALIDYLIAACGKPK